MFVTPIVIGLSIFLFAIGKLARVDKLWMFGSLFVIVVLGEIAVNLGCECNIVFWGKTISLSILCSILAFAFLVSSVSRVLRFEEKFIVNVLAPLSILYIISSYVGVLVGVIMVMIVNSGILEGIFEINRVHGVLTGVFVGGLVALSIFMWELSPLALALLSFFVLIYELRNVRESAIIKEFHRTGLFTLEGEDEEVLKLIGMLEDELETKLRLAFIDESIYLCSDLVVWHLNRKHENVSSIIKNIGLKEIVRE